MPPTASRSSRCRTAQTVPAVRERLVDGEVEAVRGLLELRPVERALGAVYRKATAGGAALGLVVGPLSEEQQLDPGVRGRFERRVPPGRGSSVTAQLLRPAIDDLGLPLGPPALEHRSGDR